MSDATATIHYTLTDEAPALATRSLLPILQAYGNAAGVRFEAADISLASRILAQFSDRLTPSQRRPDTLAMLGELAKQPHANIVKLPNISASIPQLSEAIAELQRLGFDLPSYPDDASTPEAKEIRSRYAKVLGSAVNPVLREGNSDRRVAAPVKHYAQTHPHSMGDWLATSKTRVASMSSGDFYANEHSIVIEHDDSLRIEHVDAAGHVTVLRDAVPVEAGDIVDGTKMDVAALRKFVAMAIDDAKQEGVLFSLHLKATMMKVSDPILFGHFVRGFYQPVFDEFGPWLAAAGAEPNQGLGQVLGKVRSMPADQRPHVEAAMAKVVAERPEVAMVDSDRGITNLHVPSDVIIDASMPAALRAGGRMYGPDGKLHDMLAVIPDRCYAGVYQAVIDDCKLHGQFDVATMGSVANVGLMAKKAEEYGSHDKTFEIAADGQVRIVDSAGTVRMTHDVSAGDVWRGCQTKRIAIEDWVRLGVARARATGTPAVFWLDPDRSHDRELIAEVERSLKTHDTEGLEILILSPIDATLHACERARRGLDTISVTGNVLRDYLTDLFPIIELGTSAKMLSIVPLLAGGGMFETGAGGSAPKHVQQLVEQNHLRWDSLGEFLAVAVSLEALAERTGSATTLVLAKTLDAATTRFLDENRSPSRSVGELDNRGSHFYLAMYWAESLAAQDDDPELKARFAPVAKQMVEQQSAILAQLVAGAGSPVDLGGYYVPDESKVVAAMRPSPLLNAIVDLANSRPE